MMLRTKDDVTLLGEHPEGEGFVVAHVRRENDYFSVTGEMYASRRAWELGNSEAAFASGQITDEIRATFPELAPVMDLHLANTSTGEPMHAEANGWYRLGGGDMLHELQERELGRKNYHKAPEPYVGWNSAQEALAHSLERAREHESHFWACEGPDAPFVHMKTCATCAELQDLRREAQTLNPAFAQFFVDMAARTLRCPVDELPNTQDEDDFKLWVEGTMRPRWQRAADQVNAWIDEHANEVEIPSEQTKEEEYEVELDDGLKVRAELMDEPGERDHGWYFQYKVVVEANGHTYETVFGGSIADYEDGTRNAREAAFGVLRELLDFSRYDSAEDYADQFDSDWWQEMGEERRAAWKRAHEAGTAMESALEANMAVLG